jgi:hypothetical protein
MPLAVRAPAAAKPNQAIALSVSRSMSAARAATSPNAVAIHMKSVDCCKPPPLVVPLLLCPLHLAETKWVTHLLNSASSRLLRDFSRPCSPECVEGEFCELRVGGVLRNSDLSDSRKLAAAHRGQREGSLAMTKPSVSISLKPRRTRRRNFFGSSC